MKRFVMGLIVGVVLATVGIAAAATSYSYWTQKGATYKCNGGPTSVFCKETNWVPSYQVALFPGSVTVSFQGSVIFGCKRGIRPGNNCQYFGP